MPALVVDFSPEGLAKLRRLSAERSQSAEDFVHSVVVTQLNQAAFDDAAWRERLGALLADIHRDLPTDIPPEEREADITAARDEVRQARRAARGS
jgi:hypothetical protein